MTKALALLEVLPDTLSHRHTELDIQIALASAFHHTKGRNSPEVLQTSMRARELCEQIEDTSKRFHVLARLRIFYAQSGELPTALEIAEEISRLVQQSQDPRDQITSDFNLGVFRLLMGALEDAQVHFAHGAAPGKHLRSGSSAPSFSRETYELPCRGSNLLPLWLLGYADQACEWAQEALLLARESKRPYLIAITQISAARLYGFCRNASAVAELTAAQIALCREHGLAVEDEGIALHGWALVQQGEEERGLRQLQQVLDVESKINQLTHLALFADACVTNGKIEKGMRTLARVRELVEQTEFRWCDAELYRLQGELFLNAECERRHTELTPEDCFRRSLDIARRQQAKSLELRAATSLARLWQSQGKCQVACDLLTPVYNWFSEGFDIADLKEAKGLLDELGE